MQQVVDRLKAQEDAELVLEDASQVGSIEGADAVLGRGTGLDSPAKLLEFCAGQAGRSSGVPSLAQSLGTTAVIPDYSYPVREAIATRCDLLILKNAGRRAHFPLPRLAPAM